MIDFKELTVIIPSLLSNIEFKKFQAKCNMVHEGS